MASRIDPIDNISPVRECWRLKVRIVRLWCLPSFNNSNGINSIEMIFMDEIGGTIHASVRKTLVYKFKPLLTEGQVYVFAFFGVGNNTGFFRSTRHEFRLNFQLRTFVKQCSSDLIPFYGCKFVSFEEIFQTEGDFPFLVDVIGVLTAIGTEKEYEKEGKKVKMRIMELESESLKLEVVLFGEFVDQISNFLAHGDVAQPVVVVQYAKVKTFRGKKVLQNVMYGTRVLFNPEIPEVESFKKSLPVPLEDNSQCLSLIPESQYYSVEDDFIISGTRKSIQELKDCKDDGYYIVLATVKGVSNGQNWWYTACKCNKAVSPDSGMYYCERCFCHVVNVVPRYRIKVRVVDESDSATFVIWDRDASRILRKSCSDLLDDCQKNKGLISFPDEFGQKLVDKDFLFKVEVKAAVSSHFEPSFKVNRICDDDCIITKFKDINQPNQGAEPDMTVGFSLGDNTFSLGDNTLSMEFQDVQSSATKELTPLSDDNVSLGSQPEIIATTDETPLKSSANVVSTCVHGDLSSTRMKKIKIEKD